MAHHPLFKIGFTLLCFKIEAVAAVGHFKLAGKKGLYTQATVALVVNQTAVSTKRYKQERD
jgi:hypothetical protein